MRLNELVYGIVGLGIMGGSIAKSIRENILCEADSSGSILGCNRSLASLKSAISDGIIDEAYASDEVDAMLEKCDVVFICLYPNATLDFLRKHKAHFKSGSFVTDISGVKGIFEKSLPEILRPDVDGWRRKRRLCRIFCEIFYRPQLHSCAARFQQTRKS